jgi:hypothetical protein
LQAVAGAIVGVVPLDACAGGDADRAVQRYALSGGTLLVEVRAGEYDPCAAPGTPGCADVAGHPGVRVLASPTRVWISGRDGSVVLSTTPDGLLPVETLAIAAEALAAAS